MITKKQREHVLKKIAAFKVSNNNDFFIINQVEIQKKVLTKNSKLKYLIEELSDVPFYKKYYLAKEYCEVENLDFEEITFENWKKC